MQNVPREARPCSLSAPGTLRLRQPDVFAEPMGDSCRSFLNRILTLDCVRQVDIHPGYGTAEIKFTAAQPMPLVLQRVAEVLRRRCTATARVADRLHLNRRPTIAIRVFRYPGVVSTWEVLHQLPGRLRVRHEELWRRPAAARFVESELNTVAGVRRVTANAGTGSVLILHDPRQLTTGHLLHMLEGLLDNFAQPRPRGYVHREGSPALDIGSIGLGAAAEFAIPILMPLSAGLLVATNLRNILQAAEELWRLRPGIATLYSTVVVATLASGSFFAAALMAGLMQFWDRRYHRRLAQAQHDLLAPLRRQSRFVWLCCCEGEMEIPLEQVRRGDNLAVRAGELIPADGIVTGGSGEIDERDALGEGDLAKHVNDRVYSGSWLREGELRVRVERTGDQTRLASIVAIVERTTTPPVRSLKDRGEHFACKTVPPTLATAGIGLLTGDVTTSLAILRADYASGPGMTAPLGLLENISQCLRSGIVVANPQLFGKIEEVTTLLIENEGDAAWLATCGPAELPQVASALRRLREIGLDRIGLISSGSQVSTDELAQELGFDFACGNLSPEHKARLLESYRQRGERVAFVGDCHAQPEAADHAPVVIALTDLDSCTTDSKADAFLLHRDLTKLPLLWELSAQQSRRRWAHSACTILPNLLCVAGAFTLGFTGLHTVLLTNVGTLSVYRSASRWLRDRSSGQRRIVAAGDVQRRHCQSAVPRVAWSSFR